MSAGKGQYNLRGKITIKKPDGPINFTPAHRSTEFNTEENENPFRPSSSLRRSRSNSPTSQSETEYEEELNHTKIHEDVEEEDDTTRNHEKEQTESPRSLKTNENQYKMADISIHDALTAAKIPAVPQFISPQTFHPCKGSACNFIKNYERAAIANAWDDALKISYLGSFLDGAANLWYKLYIENQQNRDKTWGDIVDDFLREFEDSETHNTLKEKVENRKQMPTESVKDYYYELKTLYYDYDQSLNINEFKKFFEKGLQEEAAYHYYWLTNTPNTPPTTMEQLKSLAVTIDKAPKRSSQELRQMTQRLPRSTQASGNPIQWANPGRRQFPMQHESNTFLQSQPENLYQRSQDHYRGNPQNLPRYNQEFRRNMDQCRERTEDRLNYNQGKVNYTTYNGTGNSNGPREPPNQRYQNIGLEDTRRLPETRAANNRPRCYRCDRVGHFAVSCPNQARLSAYPNYRGRQN